MPGPPSPVKAATDGLRRSARVRNPAKNYAAEQAEQEVSAPTPKLKRKVVSSGPGFDGGPVSAPSKKRKQAIPSSSAVLSDPANDSSEFEVEEPVKEPPPKKSKKAKGPLPLGQQERVWPHSKIYPLPGTAKSKMKGSVWHGDAAELRIQRTKSRTPMLAPGQKETRLRSYIPEPTEEYDTFLDRVNTQKMFIINRERANEEDCHAGHDDCPSEVLNIAGSKGNVYTVTISHMPSCTCPVNLFIKGGQERCCKHVLYVLHHVLKAPDHLAYQNAFLTSELCEIFDNAPDLPPETVKEEPTNDGNRKPLTDDCPICFMDFESDNKAVWCRAACGNNIHKECFGQWAKVKAGNVTCPFCRTSWESDEDGKKRKVDVAGVALPGELSASGYQNVAHLLDYE
ncbi:hypothetical protein B0A55_06030 [Friedmanniomyces simplex]|uniref:RING-type domain-containing protein n=1 Tax=Friedmanniomyces simplex TaxID=329884 RepID=A0A4U0X3R0_9PEZI|nr:hypothetical protein B0A55_06030 [Friedmanniomyces simplex]